jgi:hypothetical protein
MASRHLTLRLEADTFDRLESQSRREGRTRSALAKTLLEEGLRMEAHPGIVFRAGPAGRRPGLTAGPDVWEVVRVFQGLGAQQDRVRSDETITRIAELMGLASEQVRTALRYYAAFRTEIDTWIARVDEEAALAEAAWRREQDLLRR